ncbi:hypothetical protein [Streptomyces aidingensis]|nr:hypothetical protein [Streptomyces aidingensis]
MSGDAAGRAEAARRIVHRPPRAGHRPGGVPRPALAPARVAGNL